MSDINKININICMGSACFARGNQYNLDLIEKIIKDNNLQATVELSGDRCKNMCDRGPNMTVNGKEYNAVTKDMIFSMFKESFPNIKI